MIFQKKVPKEKESKKQEDDKYLEYKRNKELEKIVEKHNKKKRTKSLLKAHQEDLKKKLNTWLGFI